MWGRNWSYAHNGQLKDFDTELVLKNHIPVGTTDSEHAFCWLLDQLQEAFGSQAPDVDALFEFIAQKSSEINRLGIFNLILSDGQFLFAFCSNNLHWITRKAPFTKASLIDTEMVVDFKEVTTHDDIVTVIATQPLTDNEHWYKKSPGQWQLFKLGQAILTGDKR